MREMIVAWNYNRLNGICQGRDEGPGGYYSVYHDPGGCFQGGTP